MNPASQPQVPFAYLLEQCREQTRAFPEYQFKLSAALAVVLGWLLTSKETSSFVVHHPHLSRVGVVTMMTTLVACHVGWVLRHVQRANACHAELMRAAEANAIDAPALLSSLRLDPFLPLSYVVITALTSVAIVVVVVFT